MSDVSESLQVRTDSDERCIAALRQLGFNGFVFRGGRGWLTVVPYGGPESLAISDEQLAAFAAKLGAPVINYDVNDFSWFFQLALPDGRTTGFGRWLGDMSGWGLTPEQLRLPRLDESILSAVVPPARVRRYVGPTALDRKEGFEWELFAQTLGFPEFNQLNPAYATDHPDEMRSMGGIEIGQRPQSRKGHGSP